MVKNPVCISALILAFLLYSGFVRATNRHPFRCLAPADEIISMSGTVCSNPVKTPLFNGSYRIMFRVKEAWTDKGIFEACGIVNVLIPAALLESYYPGKLYSPVSAWASNGLFIENGRKLRLSISSVSHGPESFFLASSGRELGWEGNGLTGRIIRFRGLCRLQFKRLMYSWGNAGGLLLALLSGSREYTEKSVSDAFRASGLSHILALSGMHLGLFGSIARFFGRKASGRTLGNALQLGAVCFFVYFAGMSPSLFRAFLAALILYIASLLRMNRPDSLALLSTCFIIHLIFFPEHSGESAFMLSYASLGGIIIFGRMFRKVYPVFIPRKLRLSVADSSAAQLATAPVSLRFFGSLAPQGIIAAVFVSPVVFLFLYAGLFACIICLFLPFLSGPISAIMNMLYFVIKNLVIFFSFE